MFNFTDWVLAPLRRKHGRVSYSFDDEGLTKQASDGDKYLKWNELEIFEIYTTDEGPFFDDLFFAFLSDSASIIVPQGEAQRIKLFDFLTQRFPDMNLEAFISAMGSCQNKAFLIWKRPEGAPQ